MKKRTLKKLKIIAMTRLEELGEKGRQAVINSVAFRRVIRNSSKRIKDPNQSSGFRFVQGTKVVFLPNGASVNIAKLMYRRVKKEYSRGLITV